MNPVRRIVREVRLRRDGIAFHLPRRRSPVPAVVVGVVSVVVLTGAQVAIAVGSEDPARPAAAAPADLEPTSARDGAATAAPSPSVGSPDASAGPTPVQSAPPAAPPVLVELTFTPGSEEPVGPGGPVAGVVQRIADQLRDDPQARARVVGHAEPSNDPVLEEQLSLRRAERVAALIEADGVPPDRVDVVGAGATQAGQGSWGTDRRVTVEVVPG